MKPQAPATLDHAGIAALIPHAGTMCLLDRLLHWDAGHIQCEAVGHSRADHPLRTPRGLLATAAIEYAAQAMALHGALLAQGTGTRARPGMLVSARGVRLHRLRLDDLPQTLEVKAERLAGDERQLQYAFTVSHMGTTIAEGRAAVLLQVEDAR